MARGTVAVMPETKQAPARRTYRRRNAMNVSLTVAMTEDMREEVEAEAIADGVSAADVIRRALSDALPRFKERRRKRGGSTRRRPAPNGGVGEAGK